MKNKIIFRKKDRELFLLFWKKIEPKVEKLKNVIIQNTDDEIVLLYELSPSASKLTGKIIKLLLADCMVVYYKEKFFSSNLIVPSLSKMSLSILVKALSVFDKATDVECVQAELKALKNINVYSLYVFRLAQLRFRWQEVCDLFLKSLPAILETEVFMELMRYLLLATECVTKEANLFLNNNFLVIKDHLNNSLTEPINLLAENGCLQAVFELISLAPQSIKIQFNRNISPEFVCFLDNLFLTKVE